MLGCPATADAQQAAPENRFLVNTATFGSSMGDIPDDVVSKRSLYYYNTDDSSSVEPTTDASTPTKATRTTSML